MARTGRHDSGGPSAGRRGRQCERGARRRGGMDGHTGGVTRPVPADFRLALDPSVRVIDGGRALVGGSPVRVVRLTEAGGHLVKRLADGAVVGTRMQARRLTRRLLDAGLAHPRPPKSSFEPADVTVVIPTFGDPTGLALTLRSLKGHGLGRIVVVDDATPEPDATAIAELASAHGARLLHQPENRGPAAARNLGLTAVGTPLVAFVDRDVVLEDGWLRVLLDHFADPVVAAVAPRIRPRPADPEPATAADPTDATATDATGHPAGPDPDAATRARRRVDPRPRVAAAVQRVVHRYESSRSPLDLGPLEARVRSRTRVAYVPSTVLVARTEAVAGEDRFDEDLRWGEDVDLVWRLAARGNTIRYEPASHATHPVRSSLGGLLRQRYRYGTAAGPLSRRHPGAVPPVAVSPWSAASWLLVGMGQPVGGLAVAAIGTAQLPAKLGPLQQPWREAVRLAGLGTWHAWRPLSDALVRSWWPLGLAGALVSRRARRTLAVAAVATSLADWWSGNRSLDPVRFTVLHVADDVAYGSGVWAGCVSARTVGPLLPDFGPWPPGRARAGADQVPSTGSAADPEGVEAPDQPPA